MHKVLSDVEVESLRIEERRKAARNAAIAGAVGVPIALAAVFLLTANLEPQPHQALALSFIIAAFIIICLAAGFVIIDYFVKNSAPHWPISDLELLKSAELEQVRNLASDHEAIASWVAEGVSAGYELRWRDLRAVRKQAAELAEEKKRASLKLELSKGSGYSN